VSIIGHEKTNETSKLKIILISEKRKGSKKAIKQDEDVVNKFY